jgi:hypothetical protein
MRFSKNLGALFLCVFGVSTGVVQLVANFIGCTDEWLTYSGRVLAVP